MATRACDFSSFKRPPRPLNNGTISSQTASEKTSSLRSTEVRIQLEASTEDNSGRNSANRNLMTSQSVDPSTNHRFNHEHLGGSTSTFKDATSPITSPSQMHSFSSQNVDAYSSFHRSPKVDHSTIDRTTLPYDRRHNKTPKFTPTGRDAPRHDESGVASGLVFLDGGRRGVMNADSQHSLDDSLSGRRIDRSLSKGRSGGGGVNMEPYGRGTTYGSEVPYSLNEHEHQVYIPSNGTPYDVYYSPHDNNMVTQLPANAYPNYQVKAVQGSHHNMSSGESGIAGCDYNTLGMSYEACGDPYGNGDYHYDPAAMGPARRFEPHVGAYGTHQQEAINETDAPQSQGSAEGSVAREEFSQRTLLLPTDSAVRFGVEATDSMRTCDQNSSFRMGSGCDSSQKNSVPRITSRKNKSKTNFNPFKKKESDSVYRSNNIYGPKSKRPSKHNTQVALGAGGGVSTGLSFDKRPYTSTMKRPFCPRWHCIALTAAIAIAVFLCVGLVLYFYVWPSVLQPLVESSMPVDGEWGNWRPWFECSATCGSGNQNRTRECDSPSTEDGGKECEGSKHDFRTCNAPVECPDCSRICEVGTLSKDCRSCTCEGHVITGQITDEYNNPLPGVKVYKGSGATLLLAGTNNDGEFEFAGVCSNGDNELRLEKAMYRISTVRPEQSEDDEKAAHVSFSMTRLFLPNFILPPTNEERLADQKVVLCCEAQSEQPPTRYTWYKDNSQLDPRLYPYTLQNPSLVLPELMVWDSGEYACEVENEAGTVRSDPATLTIYGNWTDLCHPKPRDKFVTLPEGCSETSFNTGVCGRDVAPRAESEESESSEPTYSTCISPGQYPNDGPDDFCTANSDTYSNRKQYCCKPTEQEEVKVKCKLQDIVYDMSFKRILSCGCTLCD